MRKTGGDERRRVKMRIIDCLCKQFFLIADGEETVTDLVRWLFFFMNLHKNTHNECRYDHLHRKDSHYTEITEMTDTTTNILSDEEIDIFNAYLEDNDLPTAFCNTDFVNIYKKIVGNTSRSDKIQKWIAHQK